MWTCFPVSVWNVLEGIDSSVQSKEKASTAHRGQWADERRFYQLRWSRAAELSSDNLHTLISNLHISGTEGNLIRLAVLREPSPILLFFIGGHIKAPCQGGIVINLRVLPPRHFPCEARGKRKVMAPLKWLLCMQGEAWMYACGGISTQESACSTLSWPTRACMTW